jgi:NAD(P)-dependent dehydrogenase (short-subunit alcohol dehydrogenase family)
MLTCLVTGATDGIGLETARQMAAKGYRVLVHGRDRAKAEQAVKKLGSGEPVWGDFGELSQVVTLVDQVTQAASALDVLINNAGVYLNERKESKDGHELTFQVNHLAHFSLTLRLLPVLKAAKAARVVNVASGVHGSGRVDFSDLELRKHYDGYSAYSNSKLCNVHFTHELARKLAGSNVVTSALHPGVIGTKLLRRGFGGGGAPVESGAHTSVYCATSAEAGAVSGRYYSDSREVPCARHANDPQTEKQLWELSAKATGVNA